MKDQTRSSQFVTRADRGRFPVKDCCQANRKTEFSIRRLQSSRAQNVYDWWSQAFSQRTNHFSGDGSLRHHRAIQVLVGSFHNNLLLLFVANDRKDVSLLTAEGEGPVAANKSPPVDRFDYITFLDTAARGCAIGLDRYDQQAGLRPGL